MLSTRAAAVVAAVPSLRSVVARALHTAPTAAQQVAQSLSTPHYLDSPPRDRKSTHHRPRFETRQSRSGSSHQRLAQLERTPRREVHDNEPRQSLGQVMDEAVLEEGEEDDSGIERKHRPVEFIYHHKPRAFKPNSYPTPESSVGEEAAEPARFSKFPLNPSLVKSLEERYGETTHTTYIQSLALSHLCEQEPKATRTILGAETGSGKTLAYLLPVMHHLKATENSDPAAREVADSDRKLHPRSLVLSPTHELVRQSTAMAKTLVHGIKLSVGGMSNTKDGGIGEKRGPVDLLFGTGAMTRRMFGIRKPGMELEEGYESTEWVKVDKMDWVVIDEADVMLSRDFRQETLLILKHITDRRPNVNIIFCTATFPPALLDLLRSHEDLQKTPFTHLLSPKLHKLPRNLEARFIPRSKGDITSDVAHELRRVMSEDATKRTHMRADGKEVDRSKIIIFCNADSKVRRLSAELTLKELPNITWTKESDHRRHGSSGILKSFLHDPKMSAEDALANKTKDDSPRILITTGILSRGLDFSPLVSTVFLVDQPKDILDFMHRAGRAGRAGRKGRVVIFGMSQGRRAEQGTLGSMVKDVLSYTEREEMQERMAELEGERRKRMFKQDGWWGREAERTKVEKARKRENEQREGAFGMRARS